MPHTHTLSSIYVCLPSEHLQSCAIQSSYIHSRTLGRQRLTTRRKNHVVPQLTTGNWIKVLQAISRGLSRSTHLAVAQKKVPPKRPPKKIETHPGCLNLTKKPLTKKPPPSPNSFGAQVRKPGAWFFLTCPRSFFDLVAAGLKTGQTLGDLKGSLQSVATNTRPTGPSRHQSRSPQGRAACARRLWTAPV